MANIKRMKEGGKGGKLGHSNMTHFGYTEEVKEATRAIARALIVIAIGLFAGCAASEPLDVRDGDVIFHTSTSSQSEALRRAMGSRYTHMGVIFLRDGQPFVYEAVGPVKWTPLEEWIARGVNGKFVVKRLSSDSVVLDSEALESLKHAAQKHEGKPYDLYFEWSDDRIYCSELVWKIYNEVLGVEIGALERFEDFDLSDPLVAAKLKERFGDSVPLEEIVISPAAMFESDVLETVYDR